jgi:hypothetical protein
LLNTDDLSKEETEYAVKYGDVYCSKDLRGSLDRSLWEDFLIGQYALAGQGRNIAAAFFQQPSVPIDIPMARVLDLGNLSVTLLGSAKKNDQMVAYMKVDYKVDAYKKVFVQDSIVKGAALINNKADVAPLVELVNGQKNIQGLGMGVVDYPGGL